MFGKTLLMFAAGLFTALIAFMYTEFAVAPYFQSSTQVFILSKEGNDSVTISDMQMGTQLTKDYAELIKSRFALEEVIEQLGLMMDYSVLKNMVSVTSPDDTRIISIQVTDTNPVRAMRIANAIREASSVHIQEVMDIEAVNVAETADVPMWAAGPSVERNTALGGIFGVMIVTIITVVTYLINDTVKTAEDVERYLGLSLLAIIPLNEGDRKKKKKARRSR